MKVCYYFTKDCSDDYTECDICKKLVCTEHYLTTETTKECVTCFHKIKPSTEIVDPNKPIRLLEDVSDLIIRENVKRKR